MDGKSADLKQDKIKKLKEVMPEAFTEGRIDWEKLKAALGEDIEFKNERYVLNWAGKSDAFRVLQAPTTATLAPDRDESVNFDDTENVFIEGENLEVLKVLQKSYFGKIKMIYIDPPYNTGNDHFIYPDRFSETKEEYLGRIGDKDEAGYMTREGLFRKNSKDSGHYHSNWLSMMYPRLFLARNLLKDDGVIFVSIDDNEVHNLRLLMNEVFGEENFIVQIVWKKKTGAGSGIQHTFDEHEYVLVFGKNKDVVSKWRLTNEEDGNFKNPDNDIRGDWESCAFTAPSKNRNPNQLYMIEVNYHCAGKAVEKTDQQGRMMIDAFDYLEHKVILREVLDTDDLNFKFYDDKIGTAQFIRRWAYAKRNVKNIFDQKRVYFNGVNIPRFKKFENEYEGKALRSIYFDDFSTQQGTDALRKLFGESYVEYPKPVNLIKHFVKGIITEEDIILDFFSGSCTTAHAVLDLNKENNGASKFICVQLPEKCDEKSEAFKAGYKTIADIGKERIRRVIKKIRDSENGKLPFAKTKQDLGFKVFKLQSSNFKIWRGDNIKDGKQLEKHMQLHLDSIKKDATGENMLFELLLKSGRNLNSTIESANDYYRINDGEMVIALARIDEKIVDSILEDKPQVFITLDRLFKNNDQLKTNTLLQMKDVGIEFKVV